MTFTPATTLAAALSLPQVTPEGKAGRPRLNGRPQLLVGLLQCPYGPDPERTVHATVWQDDMRKAIEVDGTRLSYVERPGGGPVLVLIPGSFNDVRQWDEVVDALPTEWRLILFEVRGHGQSWPPPANGSIEQFAADVIQIADREGLDRFHVGGHSIGGMIALEVGRRIPARIAGVISIEGWTHWRVTSDAFQSDMVGTLTEEQAARRLALREGAAGHWEPEQRQQFAQIYRRWEAGPQFLQETELPVLELYGDRGKPKPSLQQLQIPDRDNIAFQWFEGASHELPLERPVELARVMTTFIRGVEG